MATVSFKTPPWVYSWISVRRYLSLPPTRQDLTQGQWSEGRFIVGVKGGGSGSSRDSNPAGLFWSSANLVQCEPDDPCWIWTQTWVQAWRPDYSLNWTKRFNAIQCWSKTSSPPKGDPAESHSTSNLSLTLKSWWLEISDRPWQGCIEI